MGGNITTLATFTGELIVPQGTPFIAGDVSMAAPSRRRRYNSLPISDRLQSYPSQLLGNYFAAKQERARRDLCSSPPCLDVECIQFYGQSRETGDADGNCKFDVRDVQFTQQYLSYADTQFQTPDGQDFLANRILSGGIQENEMDANKDGLVAGQDAAYLGKAAFRQYRFMEQLNVTGVERTDCEMTLLVRLLDEGDVPTSGTQTIVYFDIAYPSASIQSLFEQTALQAGSFATFSPEGGSQLGTKGSNLHGGFWQAAYEGNGVFAVRARTGIDLTNIGISVVIVTTDVPGNTNVGRQLFLDGRQDLIPLAYPFEFSTVVGVHSVHLFRRDGYNPYVTLDNQLRSDICETDGISQSVQILEGEPAGTFVAGVSAVDSSLGTPLFLPSYVIISGNSPIQFFLDSNSGILTASIELNREVKSLYNLRIQVAVASAGNFLFLGYVNLDVTLIDKNDNFPIFSRPEYNASVEENKGAGEFVVEVHADDADEGGNGLVTYVLLSHQDIFDINPSSGTVTTKTPLDREAVVLYNVIVLAFDSPLLGQQSLNSTVNVVVHVLDTNDNAPIYDEIEYSVSIEENRVEFPLLVPSVSDADFGSNAEIERYEVEVVSPNGEDISSIFQVVQGTGVVNLITQLNRERVAFWTLKITAFDNGSPQQQGSATISVIVEDVNDIIPVFASSNYSSFVAEDLISVDALTLVAVDFDAGSNANLTYSSPDIPLPFSLRRDSSFQVTIVVTGTLNRRIQKAYDFTVHVQDQGIPPLSSFTTLHVVVAESERYGFNVTNGVVSPGFTRDSPNTILKGFGGSFFNGQSGLFSVYHGAAADSASFTLQNTEAVTATLVVVDTTVHGLPVSQGGTRMLRVAVMVTNAYNSIPSASSTPEVRITPQDNMQLQQPQVGTCVADSAGICLVTLTVSDSWFFVGQARTIVVEAAPSSGALATQTDTMTLQPSQNNINAGILHNHFWIVVPAQDQYAIDIFPIPIYAQLTNDVLAVLLTLQVSVELSINHITTEPGVLITRQSSNACSGNSTVCYYMLASVTSPIFPNNVNNRKLVTMNIRVAATQDVDNVASVRCTIHTIVDGQNSYPPDLNLLALPFTSLTVDRDGASTDADATVYISGNNVRGTLSRASMGELSNTAMLGLGIVEAGKVDTYIVRSQQGSISSVATGVTCTSDDPNIVKVDANCDRVYVDGTESQGAQSVALRVSYSGVADSVVHVRVWYPHIPITVSIDDATLRKVSTWPSASCLDTRFEQAQVYIQASFSDGTVSYTQDLTHELGSLLESTNTLAVQVLDNSVIAGVTGGGTAIIRVSGGVSNGILVSTEATEVDVFTLSVTVLGSLSVDFEQSPPFGHVSNQNARVTLDKVMRRKNETYAFVVYAIMSDGRRTLLTESMGLQVSSVDEARITVQNNNQLTALRTSDGEYLNLAWYSTDCSASSNQLLIASNLVRVQVFLNDNPPNFPSSYAVSMDEEVGATTTFFTVNAVDNDLGRGDPIFYGLLRLEYSTSDGHTVIRMPDLADLFFIDRITGELTVKQQSSQIDAFDREATPSITLYVVTSNFVEDIVLIDGGHANETDDGVTVSHVGILITLNDLNDNMPVFDKIYRTRLVQGESVGIHILNTTATDPDIADNSLLTFSLGESDGGPPLFAISAEGTISLALIIPYGVLEMRTTLLVSDAGSPPQSGRGILVTEVYDSANLAYVDLLANYSTFTPWEEVFATTVSGIVQLSLHLVARHQISDGIIRIVLYHVVDGYENLNQTTRTKNLESIPVLASYGFTSGIELAALLDAVNYTQTFSLVKVETGPYLNVVEGPVSASTSTIAVWAIVLVLCLCLIAFLVAGLIYVRKRREGDEERLRQLLNERSAMAFPAGEFPSGSAVFSFSGGEVDPETGHAFFYKKTQKAKTVHTPLVGEATETRMGRRGFASTTTTTITEERRWLQKDEEDDAMELKTLDPGEAWEKHVDLAHPLHDEDELLADFNNPLFDPEMNIQSPSRTSPPKPIIDDNISLPSLPPEPQPPRRAPLTAMEAHEAFVGDFMDYLSAGKYLSTPQY